MERHDAACKLSENLRDVYHWCMYSAKLLLIGQWNCPKHVEFYSKNKFEKLVHLVGFIIRKHNIYSLSIDLGCMFWIESIH